MFIDLHIHLLKTNCHQTRTVYLCWILMMNNDSTRAIIPYLWKQKCQSHHTNRTCYNICSRPVYSIFQKSMVYGLKRPIDIMHHMGRLVSQQQQQIVTLYSAWQHLQYTYLKSIGQRNDKPPDPSKIPAHSRSHYRSVYRNNAICIKPDANRIVACPTQSSTHFAFTDLSNLN